MVHKEVVNYNGGLIPLIVELWACNLVIQMTSLAVTMIVAAILRKIFDFWSFLSIK